MNNRELTHGVSIPTIRSTNIHKRDEHPSRRLLLARCDGIVDCWQELHGHFEERFERDSRILLEREASLFSRFAEAIESTAQIQGAPRWEP